MSNMCDELWDELFNDKKDDEYEIEELLKKTSETRNNEKIWS